MLAFVCARVCEGARACVCMRACRDRELNHVGNVVEELKALGEEKEKAIWRSWDTPLI